MNEDFEKIEKMAKEIYLKFFTEAYLEGSPDNPNLKKRRERCWIHAQAFYHYTEKDNNKPILEEMFKECEKEKNNA